MKKIITLKNKFETNNLWVGGFQQSFILQTQNNLHEPEILHPKKFLASKFPTQNNTRLKYLNTCLFNQTDFKN